jgi:hypothetical protein
MKLADYQITELLQQKKWQEALDLVTLEFGIARIAIDSPSTDSMIMPITGNNELRITTGRNLYAWTAGSRAVMTSPAVDRRGHFVMIWYKNTN